MKIHLSRRHIKTLFQDTRVYFKTPFQDVISRRQCVLNVTCRRSNSLDESSGLRVIIVVTGDGFESRWCQIWDFSPKSKTVTFKMADTSHWPTGDKGIKKPPHDSLTSFERTRALQKEPSPVSRPHHEQYWFIRFRDQHHVKTLCQQDVMSRRCSFKTFVQDVMSRRTVKTYCQDTSGSTPGVTNFLPLCFKFDVAGSARGKDTAHGPANSDVALTSLLVLLRAT